jgi:xylan 1,4-beta-xylosidase
MKLSASRTLLAASCAVAFVSATSAQPSSSAPAPSASQPSALNSQLLPPSPSVPQPSTFNLQPDSVRNPIISGDWSDPGVIRVGDDYYSCRSSFGWQPGIPIIHSRDLVHWRYIGHAFTSHEKLKPGDTRAGIWGLDMGYNPNTKEFLIYAPTRDHEVYVFHSKKPQGPYEMKSLGKGLGIDPGFFADDDGRLYVTLSKGITYELSRDGLSVLGEASRIDRSRYKLFEGPAIFKRDGWYYMLFSDGGTLPREPSTISVLRSRKITGPWEEDPNNPVMFATDQGTRFEAPAHGVLLEPTPGNWFIAYHAYETSHYSLGRQTMLQPIEWTADGWWRPVAGKIPAITAPAPLPFVTDGFTLAESDEFTAPTLGLQWFFTTAPDFSGKSWSLTANPGHLRIFTQPGDLSSLSALTGIVQQRVTRKAFAIETAVTFDAKDSRETAGLHFFHDPRMNFWLGVSTDKGEPRLVIGKTDQGRRTDLWSTKNPHGKIVHLRIVVDGEERATFFHSGDGQRWEKLGESIYFGASGHHLRNGERGSPDLGWVGVYKDPAATRALGLPEYLSPEESKIYFTGTTGRPERPGNVWTGTTFGPFAIRDSAEKATPADFDYLRVTPSDGGAVPSPR